MNKSHTYSVSLLLIVFTVMILCSLFGDQIYKLTTPNVKAEVVKVAVWDNVKYNCVIEKDNIYEDSDGQYVFLIKKTILSGMLKIILKEEIYVYSQKTTIKSQ